MEGQKVARFRSPGLITLEGLARNPGIAIAVAAVVDAKNGINGVSHHILKSGISALKQGLPTEDYPEAVIACENLPLGVTMRIPGVNTVAIVAEAHADVPELPTQVPCVIGVPDLLQSIREDDLLIVDGYKGLVHIDPDPDILIHYQQAESQRHLREKVFITSEHIPARTQSGETILVYAKLDDDEQLDLALGNGADGLSVDMRNRDGDLSALCSRILREVAGKPVTFVVDVHLEEILRAAMMYCTPLQVTLVSDTPELLAAQVDSALDRIILEALQLDMEAPQVNICPEDTPKAVDSVQDIQDLVRAGVRMIAVAPELVPEAKLAIRSIGLEDAE